MTDHLAMRKYYFFLAFLVVLFDRLTKWWVTQDLPMHSTRKIVSGFFYLTHVENRGAAFSLFADSASPWKAGMLVVFSVIALVIVAALLWRSHHSMATTGVGLALIMGGAIGNLWDRLLKGRVVDFLLFYIGTYAWPAFNLADSAIVAGAGLLVIEILFARPAGKVSSV